MEVHETLPAGGRDGLHFGAPMLFNSSILLILQYLYYLYYCITLKFNFYPQLVHRKYQVLPRIYTKKVFLGRKNLLRARENTFKQFNCSRGSPSGRAIAEDDTGLAVKKVSMRDIAGA